METIPDVIAPAGFADYFEVMTRAVFQAGVAWAQIARNWASYGLAFANFDIASVAAYDDSEIQHVLDVPGILRMPRKVVATIANARALVEIERTFGSFEAYLATLPDYAAKARDIKKRFSFMGDMNVWYLLFRTQHAVPPFEAWVKTIPGDHPRMREMVDRARAAGLSREDVSG
jgi:3-methyladenine DNA glycosylase Tag